MNTQQVQIFLTVAACCNFTAAGEQLFLSQSAISYHIRAMEKELGLKLFERDTHNVRLTPAGEALSRSLSEINMRYQEALDFAKRVAAQEDHSVRICFANPTSPSMMGQIVNHLYCIPNIEKLSLVKRNYNDVLQPLLQGTADILFSYPRFYRKEPGIRMKRYCRVWTACMVSPDHSLADKETLCLTDLNGQKLLFPDCKNIRIDYGQIYSRIRNNSDITPEIDATPQTFEQVQGLAVAGRGVMLVHALDDQRHENTDGLVSIPLRDIDYEYLVMMWHKDRLDSAGKSLIENSKEPD